MDGIRLFRDRQYDPRRERTVSSFSSYFIYFSLFLTIPSPPFSLSPKVHNELFNSGDKSFGALVSPVCEGKRGGRVMLLANVAPFGDVPMVNGSIGELVGWSKGKAALEVLKRLVKGGMAKKRMGKIGNGDFILFVCFFYLLCNFFFFSIVTGILKN